MKKMKIGNRYFETKGKTYIMGILNVTPDSFSDGGSYHTISLAMKQVEEMIRDGADLIDVGGESTRPGYTRIHEEEEIDRVAPVICAIRERFDIPISVDTYKSEVAKAAIQAGADMVNDIWGLKYDERMAEVIAGEKVAVCIMHNRENDHYDSFFDELKEDLTESIRIAERAGIERERIILDPGVGFAKSLEQNLICVNRLEELHPLSYPILLGTSRKSMIGLTLNLPIGEREEGTLATTVMAVMKGCQFVRVHHVRGNKRAIEMTEAILKSKR